MKRISYLPLWKTLLEKGIKRKTDLISIAKISSGTLAKLGKDDPCISTEILTRIANSLDVNMEDIATFVEE
jgi:DNA-binding Xre family transcriptional regulator